MLKPYDPFANDENEPAAPECRATVELIQRALDGEASTETLDANPHPTVCAACRERVRAARVLLAVLSVPREPVSVPSGFADRILDAMKADRRGRSRQRVFAMAGGLAVAAAVLVAVWFFNNGNDTTPKLVQQTPELAPIPPEKAPSPELAPAPRPINIGDQFAKAGENLLETPKPLTDSVAVAPKLLDVLTTPFTKPAVISDPMANALEPARKSLTELPSVARTGLEPVTGTAEKAFNRLMRDLGAVKPGL